MKIEICKIHTPHTHAILIQNYIPLASFGEFVGCLNVPPPAKKHVRIYIEMFNLTIEHFKSASSRLIGPEGVKSVKVAGKYNK